MKLSQKLEILLKPKTLNLDGVLTVFKASSFGLVLAVVSLPSALPIPAPGMSVPFGFLVIFVAAQIIGGRKKLWLPQTWQQKEVPTKTFRKHLPLMLKFVRFFEFFIKPRLDFIFRLGVPVAGVIIFLAGVSMLIPIPGTNTLPALGAFIMALGMLERDGLALLGGALVSLLGLVVTTAVLWFGAEGLGFLLDWMQTFFVTTT